MTAVSTIPLVVNTSDAQAPSICRDGCQLEAVPTEGGFGAGGVHNGPGGLSGGGPGAGNSAGGRRPTATGPTYDYHYTPACTANGPPPGSDDALCAGAATVCSDGRIFFFVFRRELDRTTGTPVSSWDRLDSVCLGADTPLPIPAIARVAGLVRREFKADAVIRTSASYQPRDGGVVNLETIFYASTPRTITLSPLRILGLDVAITATATNYHWQWGDGESLDTASPGAPYPDQDVTHVYRRPGSYQVQVTVTYTGTYTIDGGASQPIVGTVTVPGPTAGITVREARAELVEGDEPH